MLVSLLVPENLLPVPSKQRTRRLGDLGPFSFFSFFVDLPFSEMGTGEEADIVMMESEGCWNVREEVGFRRAYCIREIVGREHEGMRGRGWNGGSYVCI